MERKVLIVTTIASMIKYFCMPLIDLLQRMGYEVQVACNFVDGNNISEEEIADFKKELTEKNVVFYQIYLNRCLHQVYTSYVLHAYDSLHACNLLD